MSCGLAELAKGNTLVGKYQKGLGFDQVGGGLASRSISPVLSCGGSPGTLWGGNVSAPWCSTYTSTEVPTIPPRVSFQRVLVVYLFCAPFHPPPTPLTLNSGCLLLHSGIDTNAPAHQSSVDKVSSSLVNPCVKSGTLTYSLELGTSGNLWSVCRECSQSSEKGSVNVRSLQEKRQNRGKRFKKSFSSDISLCSVHEGWCSAVAVDQIELIFVRSLNKIQLHFEADVFGGMCPSKRTMSCVRL